MERVAGEGRTVLFVSHNLAAVSRLCPRSMLLQAGARSPRGRPEVVDEYIQRPAGPAWPRRPDRARGLGRLRFAEVDFQSDGRRSTPGHGPGLRHRPALRDGRRPAAAQPPLRGPGDHAPGRDHAPPVLPERWRPARWEIPPRRRRALPACRAARSPRASTRSTCGPTPAERCSTGSSAPDGADGHRGRLLRERPTADGGPSGRPRRPWLGRRPPRSPWSRHEPRRPRRCALPRDSTPPGGPPRPCSSGSTRAAGRPSASTASPTRCRSCPSATRCPDLPALRRASTAAPSTPSMT